jgi:hypothetical protein
VNVSGIGKGTACSLYFGKEVGRFDGEEIYGSNGRYLGEVMSDNEPFQKELGEGEFWAKKERFICPLCELRWLRDDAGYEDFPAPDTFRQA